MKRESESLTRVLTNKRLQLKKELVLLRAQVEFLNKENTALKVREVTISMG